VRRGLTDSGVRVRRRRHLRRNPLALRGLTDPRGLLVCAPLSSHGMLRLDSGASHVRDRFRVGM